MKGPRADNIISKSVQGTSSSSSSYLFFDQFFYIFDRSHFGLARNRANILFSLRSDFLIQKLFFFLDSEYLARFGAYGDSRHLPRLHIVGLLDR